MKNRSVKNKARVRGYKQCWVITLIFDLVMKINFSIMDNFEKMVHFEKNVLGSSLRTLSACIESLKSL